MSNIVAFVHAKGSSERVKSKNLRLLGDVPLFVHAINNARKSKLIDEVVIDSESEEILEIGKKNGATPLIRPYYLANNETTGDQLMVWQQSNYKEANIVLQVIPTSPFLSSNAIDKGIQLLIDKCVSSVVGVLSEVFYEWKNSRPNYRIDGYLPNSSEKEPLIYESTGLYINTAKSVKNTNMRVNEEDCLPLFLTKLEAFDINTEEDFLLAEYIINGMKQK